MWHSTKSFLNRRRFARLLVWVAFWALPWAGICLGASHQHLNAGAYGSEPGAALYFVNGDRFAASSGYVVALEKTETGTHAGLHRGSITLTALPGTLDYGGPTFDHAAFGAHLEAVVVELDGPIGGRFGFWESGGEDEGAELTFDVPVGMRGGTNRFGLSETDGSPGVDPYGHVHGRVFTATAPGLYTVGLKLVDTSRNGAEGGPLHRESELFRLQFQAGVTVARWEADGGEVRVNFGAFSGYSYQLESSPSLGGGAAWESVGELVRGDDHVREIRVPRTGERMFFRLKRTVS